MIGIINYGPGNDKDNNCTKCRDSFLKFEEANNQNNCYEECKNNYYFDNEYKYHCTNDKSCPVDYPKIIPNKKKCVQKCKKDNIYQYEYNETCYEICPNGTESLSSKKLCHDIKLNSDDTGILKKEETILDI